jgi:hypothetical protein
MRGVLRKGGPAKVYAGGLSKGTPYVQTQVAPQSNTTTGVTIPVGYTGSLYIFLAGTASRVGAYWSADAQGGPQASGECAGWQYQCLGDETSFSLIQTNFDTGASGTVNGSAPRLGLMVNGGVNNGKELRVGSGATSGGYGAAGCPTMHAASTFANKLTATQLGYGATRVYNGTIYYSDDTSYGPQTYSSYGTGNYFQQTFNGTVVGAQFNYGGASLLQAGATIFNNPPIQYPWDNQGQSGRPGNSLGGLVLVYLNDQ